MKYTSQLLATASGSMGGCTASRNRSGAYMRARVVPVNPQTTFQNAVRASLATLVARWTSTLTAVQRAAWDTWAINTPHTDRLGNPITLTGQNTYVMMNTLRNQATLAFIDVAPIVFAGAVLTPPAITSIAASTDVAAITFTNTDLWAGAVGGALLVWTGRPQNASRTFFKGPFRFANRILGAVTPPTSPQNVTIAFPCEVGQRVFVLFRAINADARISTTWKVSALAT